MERVDYHASEKDNLYVRYIYDPSTRPRNSSVPYWSVLDGATNYFAQIGETHIFSPTAINDFRIAFNRTFRVTDLGPVNSAISSLITPSMSIVPGLPFGRIQPGGGILGIWGGGGGGGNLNADPLNNSQNLFEESDSFTLIRGPHSFKFGVDLERYQNDPDQPNERHGEAGFSGESKAFRIQAQPTMMDAGKVLGQTPFGNSVSEFGWRQWLPAWFVQDDWPWFAANAQPGAAPGILYRSQRGKWAEWRLGQHHGCSEHHWCALSYGEAEFRSPVRPGLGSDRKRQNLRPLRSRHLFQRSELKGIGSRCGLPFFSHLHPHLQLDGCRCESVRHLPLR